MWDEQKEWEESHTQVQKTSTNVCEWQIAVGGKQIYNYIGSR